MNKPEKYKSIPVSDIKLRKVVLLTPSEKTQALTILQKLTELIKIKHT